MKIVCLYNIKLEQEIRILLVVIIQGNEMSGFHYRGWILSINCFRLTSLDIISGLMDRNSKFKFGGPGSFSLIYINYIKIQYMHICP